jgi:hypothetical protein
MMYSGTPDELDVIELLREMGYSAAGTGRRKADREEENADDDMLGGMLPPEQV